MSQNSQNLRINSTPRQVTSRISLLIHVHSHVIELNTLARSVTTNTCTTSRSLLTSGRINVMLQVRLIQIAFFQLMIPSCFVSAFAKLTVFKIKPTQHSVESPLCTDGSCFLLPDWKWEPTQVIWCLTGATSHSIQLKIRSFPSFSSRYELTSLQVDVVRCWSESWQARSMDYAANSMTERFLLRDNTCYASMTNFFLARIFCTVLKEEESFLRADATNLMTTTKSNPKIDSIPYQLLSREMVTFRYKTENACGCTSCIVSDLLSPIMLPTLIAEFLELFYRDFSGPTLSLRTAVSYSNITKQGLEDTTDISEETEIASATMIAAIGFYKKFISPLMPPACRFVPTCSSYGVQAIREFGPSRGAILTSWRLLRCSPVGGKGYDPPRWPPVPYTHSS